MKMFASLTIVFAVLLAFAPLPAPKDIDGNIGVIGLAPPPTDQDDDWGVPFLLRVNVNGHDRLFTQGPLGGQQPVTGAEPPTANFRPSVILTTSTWCGGGAVSEAWTWDLAPTTLEGVLTTHGRAMFQSCTVEYATGYAPPGGTVVAAPSYISTTWTDTNGNQHTISTRKKSGESIEQALQRHAEWLGAAQRIWPVAVQHN